MSQFLHVVEFVVAALGGLAFLVGYHVRAHGAWRYSREGRHMFSFTAVIAITFTFAVAVRVVDIPGIDIIAHVLYSLIGLLLWQRFWLMWRATGRAREQRKLRSVE